MVAVGAANGLKLDYLKQKRGCHMVRTECAWEGTYTMILRMGRAGGGSILFLDYPYSLVSVEGASARSIEVTQDL